MKDPVTPLSQIRERIQNACERVGRSPDSVRLIAVSKGQAPDKILDLSRQGQREFGENYVQEWKTKQSQLQELGSYPLAWHFIGHLQSNKVSEVVGEVEYIQTVDSLKLAQKIHRVAADRRVKQKALLEVQLAPEPDKTGWNPEELLRDLPVLKEWTQVDWRGLMAIPPIPECAEDSRPFFARLKSLLDEINQMRVFNRPLTELSMGMSADFEIGVEEGATMVRIGTALFGPRT